MRSLVKIIVNGTAFVFLIVLSLRPNKDMQYYEKEIEKLKRIVPG